MNSCAIDGERFLIGWTCLDLKYKAQSTPIGIYQGRSYTVPQGNECDESVPEVVDLSDREW